VPPRPEIIDRLFDARYELEKALFITKAQAEKRYAAVLAEAATQFDCAPDELRDAPWLREYYRGWKIEKGLIIKRNRK